MQFRHLQSFVTVAEQGSFSKAAHLLYTSPTALTQQLNSLERDLQFELFVRSYRGVTLTPAGTLFLDYAKKLLDLGSEAVSVCQTKAGVNNHRLTIGCYRENTYNLLYPNMKRLTQICPDLELVYHCCDYRSFFELLEKGQIDTFLHPFASYIADHRLCFLKMGTSRLFLSMIESHPLAKKSAIELNDLHGQKLIISAKAETRPLQSFFDYIAQHDLSIEIVSCNTDEEIFSKMFSKNHIFLTLEYCCDPPLGFTMRPLGWPHTIDYGFIYTQDPSPALRRFLHFMETFSL